MLSLAVTTSLVFARFSKPTARILFSRIATITPYEGVPTLMMRVANQRHSYILEAMASMVLLRDVETTDGHSMRRFYDLKLERSRSPMFALSWQIMHRIDESSPLHGVSAADFKEGDMRLAVTISGVDETFAAGITARYDYAHETVVFDRRFVDIFSEGDHPRHIYVNLERFHDLEPSRRLIIRRRSGIRLFQRYVADPVASTPIEPVGGAFVVQRGRHTANRYGEGRVERVDVDDGIKFSVDQTGDGRRDAAFCANVELRRPGAELVLRRGRWIADVMSNCPSGLDVQMLPCFVQKEHVQARATISTGFGSHASTKRIFPQWQPPAISMSSISASRPARAGVRRACTN